nr:MAG: hypothetical protein [Bacteriophage sp.]
MGGIKIGNIDSNGVYVGDKLVAGNYFDFSQLWSNLVYTPDDKTDSYNAVLIVNLSTDNITFSRNGQKGYVNSKSIDWFAVGILPGNVVAHSIINGNRTVNAIIFTVTIGNKIEIVTKRNISADETIISYGQVNVSPFGRTIIVFDA